MGTPQTAYPSSIYTHTLHTAHHLATSQPEACAHSGTAQPQVDHREEAHTGLVSGLGVTGTRNARVSVPAQGLEVEAQVSGGHNSWPLRFLIPWGESH